MDIDIGVMFSAGERIKLERMKREEIINCHCGFREEDGLMVQCELCLCWQHALCHNIEKVTDVSIGLFINCLSSEWKNQGRAVHSQSLCNANEALLRFFLN